MVILWRTYEDFVNFPLLIPGILYLSFHLASCSQHYALTDEENESLYITSTIAPTANRKAQAPRRQVFRYHDRSSG